MLARWSPKRVWVIDCATKSSEIIDAEIEALGKEAGQRAEAVLKANRRYLDELAKALLEKETLEEEEVSKILNGTTLPEIAKLHK